MTGPVRIRLASAVALDVAGRTLDGRELGSRKARTLLALLAAERGRLVPLDRVVHVLWPEDPPGDPAANVSTLVSRSRRLLGDALVAAPGRAYGLLDGGAWTVDLDEASGWLAEAEVRRGAGELGLVAAGARRALDVLGDQPALVDEPDAEWVLPVRQEADTLRRRARHLLAGALTPVDPAQAARVATAAVRADPFDEQAVRDLVRALVADGRTAAALSTYDELVRLLREELGTDPDHATAELHLAVLRETGTPATRAEPRPTARSTLVGREAELAVLDRAWTEAGSGDGALYLVQGEAGIGKTRLLDALADLAGRTGGVVLGCRCHPTERSLFLQPYVDALRPVLLDHGEVAAAALAHGHENAWVALLPELALLVPAGTEARGTPELERRRAYDAVAAVLRRLARRRPVLLTVDDLQEGGAATVDLLGYLAERLRGSPVLLVAAVRAEDGAGVGRLADRARRLPLGALSASAVGALAAAAGLSSQGAAVMERTGGHTLSVVECLRAIAAGDLGVPRTLAESVLVRVDALEPGAREVLRAASVLRSRLDPHLLAGLTETTELSVVRHCEELVRVRLLARSDTVYEFANDLVQECVHASLAPALAAAHHRRAADLTTARPEVMAEHAFATGDTERAAGGWLLAGEAAMRRSAVDDAIGLYGRGLSASQDPGLLARLRLARAWAHEARTSYDAALADIDVALDLARGTGDRRLEMNALRARGGDAPVGLHLATAEVTQHLEAGLALASGLGDRRAEADFTTRLTILEASRLQLGAALSRAEASLRRARASASEEATVLGLDGVKTVLAYLGDADRLAGVVADLELLLRRHEDPWLQQWVVFESALVPAAAGDWDAARARVLAALEINRTSGYRAYGGYFEAHQGWFDRLAGDLDGALAQGRRAVARTSPVDHPWWYATAAGLLAATLVEADLPDEAEGVARRGLAATGADTPEAWRLRCLAPLAAVSGDEGVLAEASAVLDGAEAPPGQAWVVGADCYLLVARAHLRHGDPAAAARDLAPLEAATGDRWRPVRDRVDALLAQISSVSS
jgi:DNA-binding SARP family transcriptional activator/tetratricopeptide (TPR) repeat protein